MVPDDSNLQIVSEILQEMGNPQSNMSMNNNSQNMMNGELSHQMNNASQNMMNDTDQVYMANQQHLARQFDSDVNMPSNDNIPIHENSIQPEFNNMDQDIHMEQEPIQKTLKNKIIEKIKDPVIVLLIAFAINTPVFKKVLGKYLPKLFGEVTLSIQYMGEFLKALIVGVMFFGIKSFI